MRLVALSFQHSLFTVRNFFFFFWGGVSLEKSSPLEWFKLLYLILKQLFKVQSHHETFQCSFEILKLVSKPSVSDLQYHNYLQILVLFLWNIIILESFAFI